MSGLTWKRIGSGDYQAGRYRVTKNGLAKNWHARGPGGPTVGIQMEHRTKALAQKACEEAHAWRVDHGLETCPHSWTTGTGPDDPADTGVHMCIMPGSHDSNHLCQCGAIGEKR